MDRDIELSHVNSEVKKKNWRDRNEGKELKKKKICIYVLGSREKKVLIKVLNAIVNSKLRSHKRFYI